MSASQKPAARLGKFGVWSGELRFAGPEAGVAGVRELEALGYGAAWTPGGIDDKVLDDIDRLLSATKTITLATGILNIWKHRPEDVGAWWARQTPERQGRVMIGLGVSHGPIIGEAYAQQKPLELMRGYVQQLLDAGVPAGHLCVAALGPKMLELSAKMTAGAHPYLVTPEHTAEARKILGPDALLAPEQGVILETDPAKARELGRQALVNYLHMPNYLNSWRRLGFSEDDLEGSDRLVDALFAWGDAEAIAGRVREHLDAGADHVCIQAIRGPMGADLPGVHETWRKVAAALL
jgi:probable F420-dependent oxidoreductase